MRSDAARRFGVSVSCAIKLAQRVAKTGSAARENQKLAQARRTGQRGPEPASPAGAGAASAALDMPIQWDWRDINAAAGHVSHDVQTICALAGQVCFGLEPVRQF